MTVGRVVAVNHVGVSVRDLAVARDFWIHALGALDHGGFGWPVGTAPADESLALEGTSADVGLLRTDTAFVELFAFGSPPPRERAGVHQMHTRVRGTLPRTEGRFPAGTPYDAFDPRLMLWTMAVLADSSRACFEALVRPLTPDEREELWQDWVRFGELFGMPRDVAPATADDFDAWMAAHLAGPDFHVTQEARVVGRAIAHDMPVPAQLRIGTRGTNLVVVGILPPRVRDAFGLRWSPAHAAGHRALTAAVRASQHVVPDRARLGRNTRLFRIVAATERKVIATGGTTIELPVT